MWTPPLSSRRKSFQICDKNDHKTSGDCFVRRGSLTLTTSNFTEKRRGSLITR